MLLYEIFNYIGVIALFIYNLSRIKNKKEFLGKLSLKIVEKAHEEKQKRGMILFFAVIETLIISVFQYFPAVFLNSPFGDLVDTGANYFATIYLCLLFLFAGCWMLRIPWRQQIDLVAPGYPLALIFAKIGCFYGGCCGGFSASWGLYNRISKSYEFPCQLVEAVVAFFLFLFLHHLANEKRVKQGTLLPTYVILYSGIRFFTEFIRMEPNVLGIFKKYHFFCILGVLIGIFEYLMIVHHNNRVGGEIE